jgi:hypothetical protein
LRRLDYELGLASARPTPDGLAPTLSHTERRIVETLEKLAPSAALSYRQAIHDLMAPDRVSFRGTASELRAAVWDVLDRLAPDSEVQAGPSFRLEAGREKPTMKQKARHILRSRAVSASARSAPEAALDALEGHIAALTRAVYDRSSMSTHASTARAELLTVKMYVDTVLAELLSIHR